MVIVPQHNACQHVARCGGMVYALERVESSCGEQLPGGTPILFQVPGAAGRVGALQEKAPAAAQSAFKASPWTDA